MEKTVIVGVTEEGERFRPSDWCKRLASSYATMDDSKRLQYNPLIVPCLVDGYNGLMLDGKLKENNSAAYNHVLDFAESNKLKIIEGRRSTHED